MPAAHPAAFPEPILAALRALIPMGIVLDVFGGIGKLGGLGPGWRVISHEIEPEWAAQGYSNGCALCVRGDARALPFRDACLTAIATSPAYGNRLADAYAPVDDRPSHRTRRTYRLALGRPLTEGNGGGLAWGAEYRKLHFLVWRECYRVLAPGGVLVLNVKDHVRAGELQPVSNWHGAALAKIGFSWEDIRCIPLKGDQNTHRMRAQGKAVVDREEISVWRKP